MIKKTLDTLSVVYRNHTYKNIFIGVFLCCSIVVLFFIFVKHQYPNKYVSGPNFSTALLEQGIKEIPFLFNKEIISFTSYEDSINQWNTIVQPSIDDPSITGSIRTISGKKFVLVLDKPIAPNQPLSISYNPDIRSLNNEPVIMSINYTQSLSSPFVLEGMNPRIISASRNNDDLYSCVYLEANMPIHLKKLRKALSIMNTASQNIMYTLNYTLYTNDLGSISTIVTNYQQVAVSMFGLKSNTTYNISVNHDLLNNTNTLDNFKYSFSTYSQPIWKGVSVFSLPTIARPFANTSQNAFFNDDSTDQLDTNFYVGDDILLHNINPIKSTNNIASILTIEPEVKNIGYTVYREGIRISGDFEGNREYILEFHPNKLKDIYNQPITNIFSETIQINHKKPMIQQMENLLILHQDNPVIPIEMVNVTNLKISYQLINSAYYTVLAFNNKYIPLPIQHTNIKISGPVDQPFWYNFDVKTLTSSYKSMLLLVNIKNADDPNSSSNFTKVFTTKNGLFAHISIGDLLFYARSFNSDQPIENLMISIWDPVRGSFHDLGRTTSEGFLRVPNPKLPLKSLLDPLFIGMTEDKDHNIAFVGTGTSQFKSINNQFFSESAHIIWNDINISQKITSMLFTERPLYHPGETIHIHALARGKLNSQFISTSPFFKQPVTIKIFSPSHQELTNITKYWSDMGSIDLSFETHPEFESGTYRIQISNNSSEFIDNTIFHLQHFTEKKAEMIIKSPTNIYHYGNELQLSLRAQFLSGEYIPTPIQYSITSNPIVYNSIMFPNHCFQETFSAIPAQQKNSNTKKLLVKKQIQSNDKIQSITVSQKLYQMFANNSELTIEASGHLDRYSVFSNTNKSIKIYTRSQFGIHATKTIITNQEPIYFNVVAIDPLSEKIQSNIPAIFSIYKDKKLDFGKFNFLTNYVHPYVEHRVFRKKLCLGQKDICFMPKKSGKYRATLSSLKGYDKIISSVDFTVLNKEEKIPNRSDLTIISDKSLYQSGDNAVVYIQNPFPYANILLIVERDMIREFYTIKSANTVISHKIPLTSEDEPGINITAFVSSLSTDLTKENPSPQFKFGTFALRMKSTHKTLDVDITSKSSNYTPGDTIELKISASSQNQKINGEAVVIIRDKASLNIISDSIPDPIERYYNFRPYNFNTWDSSVLLLETLNFTNHLSKNHYTQPFNAFVRGISNTEHPSSTPYLRSQMKQTLFYKGTVQLFDNKNSIISFTLPDNISGFNITVLAYDKDQLFGLTNTTFTTSKSFLVDPILPKFVRPNDIVTWGATLRNFTDHTLALTTTLSNYLQTITTNSMLPGNSSILITNDTPPIPNTFSKTSYPWTIYSTSTTLNDGILKDIPVVYYTPWITSSYSGIINTSTNITVPMHTYSDSNNLQKLSISISTSPLIKTLNILEDIITNKSVFIENVVKRIKVIAGHTPLLIENHICGLTKSELSDLIKKDLKQLKTYKISSKAIATTPTSLFTSECPLLILKIYESLLIARNANYFIDNDLFAQLSLFAQKFSKTKTFNSPQYRIVPAYAYKLLALDRIIDKDSFCMIYPSLSQDLESQALILDTMHILGFSLDILSAQTSSIIKKTMETGNHISIPNNSPIVAYTLIKNYGTMEESYKIINTLHKEKKVALDAFLAFSEKYPETTFMYPIHVKTSIKDFTLTENLSSMTLEIKNSEDPLIIDIKTKNPTVFFCMNHSYTIDPQQKVFNVGYNIEKRILDLNNNVITDHRLELGKSYIIELEITPKSKVQQQIEIIDPIYAGITIALESEQKKYLNSNTITVYQDRVHIFSKLLNQKSHKIRYLITASIPGYWTAPMISAHNLNSPEVFGYCLQERLIIK